MAVASWSALTTSGVVRAVSTDRDDGDFNADHVDRADLERRRRRVVDLPWTMLAEEHGTTAVVVRHAGDRDGLPGDVAVTDAALAVLGIWVGDCAPVAIVTPAGRVVAVHAGWRGIALGILDVAVDALAAAPGAPAPGGTVAHLGPCIGACCDEFGAGDLARVASGVGADAAAITGRTTAGARALDLPRAVAIALARRGVALDVDGRCTGCDPRLYSHRVGGDRGRQVLAVWKDPSAVVA